MPTVFFLSILLRELAVSSLINFKRINKVTRNWVLLIVFQRMRIFKVTFRLYFWIFLILLAIATCLDSRIMSEEHSIFWKILFLSSYSGKSVKVMRYRGKREQRNCERFKWRNSKITAIMQEQFSVAF